MGILTKDQILAVQDLKEEKVSVPEWGGDVIMRTMKAIERDQFEDSMFSSRGTDQKANLNNLRARFLSLILIDDSGNRLFESMADVKSLGNKSASVLDTLFVKGRKLNGMSDGDVEELTKNLPEGQDADSHSD